MSPRLIMKRFSHIHTPTHTLNHTFNHKSTCYENIHKINNLREDVNEIKNILHSYHEPIKVIYVANIFSFVSSILIFLSK